MKNTVPKDKSQLLPADPEPEDEPEDKPELEDYATFEYTGRAFDTPEDTAITEDNIEDNIDGWKDDEVSITFTDIMLKAAREKYRNARKIMSPDDPRMKMINSALWTWS